MTDRDPRPPAVPLLPLAAGKTPAQALFEKGTRVTSTYAPGKATGTVFGQAKGLILVVWDATARTGKQVRAPLPMAHRPETLIALVDRH